MSINLLSFFFWVQNVKVAFTILLLKRGVREWCVPACVSVRNKKGGERWWNKILLEGNNSDTYINLFGTRIWLFYLFAIYFWNNMYWDDWEIVEGIVQINICLQYLSYFKKCSYILILIHCKVDACTNMFLRRMTKKRICVINSLCLICQKDEDADGLREYCSGIPKLIEYGALFALKLLFIFKYQTKWRVKR